ncbi:MAG: 2-C-methyl-D-erythritol 2,4-cyclodiphosphate synthase [Eubacteriales bacterium]|nr:2-C-methyl-D-erythritol 2,4-cyclodiphosphate synthase [Eubacteriales bacterium]
MFDVIIPAAGESSRFSGNLNKLFCTVNGRTVLENSVLPFLAFQGLEKIIVAVNDENFARARSLFDGYENVTVILGGSTRTDTVKRALERVTAEFVLIHDGARPYVSDNVIKNVLDALNDVDAVVPVIKLDDSIANVKNGYSAADRENFRRVQTPQGFRTEKLKTAYARISSSFTDDASVYLTLYDDAKAVDGDVKNIKITKFSDLETFPYRSGIGIDTHKLVENRKLVLGGVEIPFEKGLLGHSDADVLTHAVMDAILTAIGERDIGVLFPDTDEKYKGISSMLLLKEVLSRLDMRGYVVKFVSATVACQRPKLNPYFDKIRTSLSHALSICKDNLSLAFTTTEGLGLVGAGDGISVIASATVVAKQ